MTDKSVFQNYFWLNRPRKFEINGEELALVTEPGTDLWQRTYYGFQNDNAPAFLTEIQGDFTMQVKTRFAANHQYDQCGILLYHNSENWVKASVEYENEKCSRLGSVVTNLGFSDWASTDIPSPVSEMWYRFSRRDQDFLIESSTDGSTFSQMRILHLHTSFQKAKVGVYACSPLKSSFKAVFSELKTGPCRWPRHN
jgi:regulation of enolase protein 1 (concanavalin A-like superfamily)